MDRHATEDAPEQGIDCGDGEDRMYETAKLLDVAVKAHMQMFGIDRKTSRFWITSAAEISD